jgi:F420H(2)-dependent quinone reductase
MGRSQQERLRQMYVQGRGNATARRYARLWSWVFRLGLQPRRWVTLEVRGRRSGQPTRFPLGMTDVSGEWYLVSMLGECNWVRNVRAAKGRANLLRRGSRPVMLDELDVAKRAPVIKHYLGQVPGGRPHIPVDRLAPVEAFEAIAADYPVFHVTFTAVVPGNALSN